MASDDPRTWSWTVDEMLAEGPCAQYDRPRITTLWARRERLSLREILDLDIPDRDKIWVLTRHGWPAWIERLVTRAVRDHARRCGVREVEQWAARWLDGTDRTDGGGVGGGVGGGGGGGRGRRRRRRGGGVGDGWAAASGGGRWRRSAPVRYRTRETCSMRCAMASDETPQREMTLREWVERLPESHFARREYRALTEPSAPREAPDVAAAICGLGDDRGASRQSGEHDADEADVRARVEAQAQALADARHERSPGDAPVTVGHTTPKRQALAESQRMCLAQARDLDVERTLRRHDNEALEVAQLERDFIRSALAAAQQSCPRAHEKETVADSSQPDARRSRKRVARLTQALEEHGALTTWTSARRSAVRPRQSMTNALRLQGRASRGPRRREGDPSMLLTVWNGTLEHDRHAPALSRYVGNSQLLQFQSHARSPHVEKGWVTKEAQAVPPGLAAQMRHLAKDCGWSVRKIAQKFHRRFAEVRKALEATRVTPCERP